MPQGFRLRDDEFGPSQFLFLVERERHGRMEEHSEWKVVRLRPVENLKGCHSWADGLGDDTVVHYTLASVCRIAKGKFSFLVSGGDPVTETETFSRG